MKYIIIIIVVVVIGYIFNIFTKPFFPTLILQGLISRASCQSESYIVFEGKASGGWVIKKIATLPEMVIDDQESIDNVMQCIQSPNSYNPEYRCLGIYHATGIKRGKSLSQAIDYFDKAAKKGDTWSKKQGTYLKINHFFMNYYTKEQVHLSDLELEEICLSTSNYNDIRLIADGFRKIKKDDIAKKCEARVFQESPLSLCLHGKKLYDHSDRGLYASEILTSWSRAAYLYGDKSSIANLGLLYEVGLGVAEDKFIALEMYKLAEEWGERAGIRNRAFLLETMRYKWHIDNHSIQDLYIDAARRGDLFSMQKLRYKEPMKNDF